MIKQKDMKNKLIIMASVALAFMGCTHEAPDANLVVTLDKAEYKVGEPVTFHINGDADNIVFYSGEIGHE